MKTIGVLAIFVLAMPGLGHAAEPSPGVAAAEKILAAPSFTLEGQFVGGDDDGRAVTVFHWPIVHEGDLAVAYSLNIFDGEQTLKNGKKAAEIVSAYQVNCKAKTGRVIGMAAYDLKGQRVDLLKTDSSLAPIKDTSVLEDVRAIACDYKPAKEDILASADDAFDLADNIFINAAIDEVQASLKKEEAKAPPPKPKP